MTKLKTFFSCSPSALAALVLVAAVLALPASAHHSISAQYDHDWPFSYDNAVLTSVRWINPHVYLFFDVENEDGEVVEWSIHTTGIQGLRQLGLGRELLVPGQTYGVRGVRAHNGDPNGFLSEIIMPDGRSHQVWAGDPFGGTGR